VYLKLRRPHPVVGVLTDFAPDEKFNLHARRDRLPERFIRAYHIRDPRPAKRALAGRMTLEPKAVSEAWCHHAAMFA